MANFILDKLKSPDFDPSKKLEDGSSQLPEEQDPLLKDLASLGTSTPADTSEEESDSEPVTAPSLPRLSKTKQIPQKISEEQLADKTSPLVDRYKEALGAANQQAAFGSILSGLTKMAGGAIGGSKAVVSPDTKGIEQAGSLLANAPKEVLAVRDVQKEAEMNDPNSKLSKALREQYSSIFGKPLDSNISAAQLENSGFGKLLTAKISADARSDVAKQTALMRQMALQQRADMVTARVDAQAKTEFERVNKDNLNRLQNAQNVESLASRVKAGDIIPSSNVASQLTNDLSQLMLGSQRSGVTDREHTAIKTLQTELAKIASFASNKPQAALPPAYLDQILKETEILKDKYAKGVLQNTDRLVAGTSKKLPEKIDSFNNQANSYLMNLGYDPQEIRSHYAQPKTASSQTLAGSSAKTAPATEGKILVGNGKESYFIDPSDLEHAEKEGFKRL